MAGAYGKCLLLKSLHSRNAGGFEDDFGECTVEFPAHFPLGIANYSRAVGRRTGL
jgi:hypothetical protein